ncbi:MAG: hypothetical protein SFV17_24295 [Candidatus Obscuribacter sp.]|nr:hypothetical protein [Candidatus Melainabacteria bacterium]MDX1989834.1 hypothetical protein [Candidatus Obscuribacter sp.]
MTKYLTSILLSLSLATFANCASAYGNGYGYTEPNGGVPAPSGQTNQSANTNVQQANITPTIAPNLGQEQQQGQGQNQYQQNLANGGALNLDSHDRVNNKSYTVFGPAANAIRSSDCAGTADGFSLYTYLGGIGYSHAPESMPCRMQQQIQLTCGVANTLVQTGAVLAQNNQLNQTGYRILNRAIEALDQCIIQLKGSPLAVELAQNYGKNYGSTPLPGNTLPARTEE